jgi:hypothetical protein
MKNGIFIKNHLLACNIFYLINNNSMGKATYFSFKAIFLEIEYPAFCRIFCWSLVVIPDTIFSNKKMCSLLFKDSRRASTPLLGAKLLGVN